MANKRAAKLATNSENSENQIVEQHDDTDNEQIEESENESGRNSPQQNSKNQAENDAGML